MEKNPENLSGKSVLQRMLDKKNELLANASKKNATYKNEPDAITELRTRTTN